MLLALPSDCPLFKELRIQRGDHVLFKNEVYLITKQTEDYNLAVSEDYKTIRVPIDEYRFWGFCPILSQEQLQTICMKASHCDAHDLLRFFEAWLYKDDIQPVVKFEDFRDLWLQYTMWVLERKEWNKGEWT